jgi:predicted DsbA family dithiol-disulfide isomerase
LQTLPSIARDQVEDGILRIVFLELPYQSEHSWPAAMLAKCVWRQVAETDPNLFWKWDRAVFEYQKNNDNSRTDLDVLLEITRNAGIDTAPIQHCLKSREKQLKRDINAEIDTAHRANIHSTPQFILFNHQTAEAEKIYGAQPYMVFRREIVTLNKTQ